MKQTILITIAICLIVSGCVVSFEYAKYGEFSGESGCIGMCDENHDGGLE